MKLMKKVLSYCFIMVIAGISAMSYELFVFPNSFAPSGLNGLCTMFQHITGISMGYLSLLLNLPLAYLVYKKISRTLAIRALVYVATFSTILLALDSVDLSGIAYVTENGTSTIIGPLVAGLISGFTNFMLLKAGSYTGGTDYIASLIHKYHPEFNFFWTAFSLNIVVAVISFFVYGYRIEPVLMCVLYCFMASTVMDRMNKGGRSAVRFEIITCQPEELSKAIIQRLHHSATLLPGRGAFRGQPTSVIICVVNRTQAAQLSAIIHEFPGSFAIVSQVSDVVGNFKRLDNQGRPAQHILDEGDGTGI